MIHAFVSDGRLYVRTGDDPPKEIESRFVREKFENAEHHNSRSGWKNKASEENPHWGSSVIWGGQASSSIAMSFRFKDVVIVDENNICYTLTNNMITGLFRYDIANDEELRLFHKKDFVGIGIDYSRCKDEFVIAVEEEDSRSNLQLFDSKGSFSQEVTAGDSRDCNPVFSKTDTGCVLFQSSGIARNEQGYAMAYSPESIRKLDVESGQMTEIIGDDQFDYLLPKDDSQGNIYCIRRPYKQMGYVSPLKMLMEVLMFPFRFLMAIVNFLNAFTELFSRKPMRPAGLNVHPPAQNKYVRVLGQTIDLAKIQRRSPGSDNTSLVPGSWELIRLGVDGHLERIASGISSYDIDQDGNVHYTNGYKVSEVADSKPSVRFRHNIIEKMRVAKSIS